MPVAGLAVGATRPVPDGRWSYEPVNVRTFTPNDFGSSLWRSSGDIRAYWIWLWLDDPACLRLGAGQDGADHRGAEEDGAFNNGL